MKRLCILIGGTGSNMCAIVKAIQKGHLDMQCVGVISHRASAKGIEKAQALNVPVEVIDHHAYPTRGAFEQALAQRLEALNPDWIALAGFMRILSPEFIKRFENKILNIHPSLLPKYKGLNTHQRVLDAKDDIHGATVHLVTEELDDGPILGQMQMPVLEDDTPQSLQTRLHDIEHILYVEVLKSLAFEKPDQISA